LFFSRLLLVGIAIQWTWVIIKDNMNVCQNCFDSTSRGPVYELLAIYFSISPKLDS